VNPSQGRIDNHTKEIRISLCMSVPMLKALESDAIIVFSLSDKPPEKPLRQDAWLQIKATMEPSVMRMSLTHLAALGSKTIISDSPLPSPPAPLASTSGVCLPPKEVMAVMQWVLRQSRDEAPGSLRWWPDPLLDGARKGQDEVNELQRYIENGWPLPTDSPQMPARAAAVFLLRWLMLLPEPVLPVHVCEQFTKEGAVVKTVLQGVQTLARIVIVCVVSLFAQLSERHCGGNDANYSMQLANCLTQQVPPPSPAEQLLNALLAEFKSDASWPPMSYLAASL